MRWRRTGIGLGGGSTGALEYGYRGFRAERSVPTALTLSERRRNLAA
jgi:hypothetical protein